MRRLPRPPRLHHQIRLNPSLRSLQLLLRGQLGQEKAETVEIIGLYWHFVDIIWIIIFTVVYLTV